MDFTRRNFVKSLVAFEIATYSPESEIGEIQEEEDQRFDEGVWERFSHTLWGNARAPLKIIDIASGFSRTDANYYWRVLDNVWDEIQTGKPASFMNYCPDVATISPPGSNVSARFDESGRVSGLRADGSDQLPYKQIREVDRSEGIFSGVRVDGEVSWLPFDSNVEVLKPGNGISRFKYEMEDLGIIQDSYIEEGNLKLLYSFKNKSDESIKFDFLTRAKLNANDNFQNPLAFKTEENQIEADESIQFTSKQTDSSVRMSMEGVDEILTGHENIDEHFEEGDHRLLKELVKALMDKDEEEMDYSQLPDPGNIEETVQESLETLEGRYPTGLLKKEIVLGNENGKEELVEVEVDVGKESGNSLLMEEGLTGKILSYLREDGAISASHNLSPMYYPAWPRDDIFAFEAIAEQKPQAVEKFFNRFLPEVQRDNGSFNQCYHADGTETGTWYSELDQPAIIATMMPKMEEEYSLELDDEARVMYSLSVQRIAEKIKNGMIPSTPDIAEQPDDGFNKTLWTASYCYQTLKTASERTDLIKNISFSSFELEQKAETIKDRIKEDYFDEFFRTNASLIGEPLNPSNAYARIVTDTNALTEEHEETLLDYLNKQKDTADFWTPGIASLGYVLREKGGYEEDVAEIEEAVANAFTDAGHLPERVKGEATQDASELAWGLAEAKNLLEGSEQYDTTSPKMKAQDTSHNISSYAN